MTFAKAESTLKPEPLIFERSAPGRRAWRFPPCDATLDDTDPDAVTATGENAARNRVGDRIEARVADAATADVAPAPLVLANLLASAHAALAARYPLQCIVPPNRFFLNSSFSQSDRLRRRQAAPVVFVAPADAGPRGIRDGDPVDVFNDRGRARFTARITGATRPGVVVIEGIWWHRFHPGGAGVNVLTDDRVADMGGGPAFHSNLVEIGIPPDTRRA